MQLALSHFLTALIAATLASYLTVTSGACKQPSAPGAQYGNELEDAGE